MAQGKRIPAPAMAGVLRAGISRRETEPFRLQPEVGDAALHRADTRRRSRRAAMERVQESKDYFSGCHAPSPVWISVVMSV